MSCFSIGLDPVSVRERIQKTGILIGELFMDTISLTFKYTQAEYVKADRQHLIASKTISKTSIVVLAAYLPASVLYFLFSSFSVLSIITVVIAVVAAITGSALYFYIPSYRFKQTSKYHDEYILAFSGSGIKFKTPSIDSELKWNIYSEIWESKDFYFLIQVPKLYTLIPKRAFKDFIEMQNFEEIVQLNLKCTKRMI